MASRVDLTRGARVILDAAGDGEIRIGPERYGRQTWYITTVILKTSRPGKAPIPRAEVWQDTQDENGQKGLTYDGSFASGSCDITLTRGQEIICRWTGGQSGDIAYLTVAGEQE